MDTQPSDRIEPSPTVYVVDDDPAMRSSLRWLIESVGLAVCTCSSAREFLATYRDAGPGCLVLDVRMPGMSGLDLQSELTRQRIEIPVLIITGYAEVPLAVRAMKAGAFDFIEKPFSDQTLLDRIRAAVTLDEISRRRRSAREQVRARMRLLTHRERDVMERVISGKSNKVIAGELNLSMKTVEVHRSHVMEKLEATSLADLIRLALLAEGNDPDDTNNSSGSSGADPVH
ncbi:MAG TPA: response regulator transcription factor [Candidatus Dormibacteraeota bacterium]|nr:response regulator transcription factor [Candidatus Dormibacteraeota bacterium]